MVSFGNHSKYYDTAIDMCPYLQIIDFYGLHANNSKRCQQIYSCYPRTFHSVSKLKFTSTLLQYINKIVQCGSLESDVVVPDNSKILFG